MAPLWWVNMSRRMRVLLLLLGAFVAVMLSNAFFGSVWIEIYRMRASAVLTADLGLRRWNHMA
jgi:hypothetical protein